MKKMKLNNIVMNIADKIFIALFLVIGIVLFVTEFSVPKVAETEPIITRENWTLAE